MVKLPKGESIDKEDTELDGYVVPPFFFTCSVCGPGSTASVYTEGLSRTPPPYVLKGREVKEMDSQEAEICPHFAMTNQVARVSHSSFLSFCFFICKLGSVHCPLLHQGEEGTPVKLGNYFSFFVCDCYRR